MNPHSALISILLIALSAVVPSGISGATVQELRRIQKNTPKGPVQGRLIRLGVRGLSDVEVYLGIPYAAVPVANNRFMFPQDSTGWKNIRDATRPKPVCIQNLPDLSNEAEALKTMPLQRYLFIKRLTSFLSQQSEDCLFLNMYVPAGRTDRNALPVVMFVHGESYEWNSGNAYDGSVLAAYGEVIVVTVSYRLGALGFLSTGQKDEGRVVGGNFALVDVIEAVETLRSIVSKFNGDPSRITLIGSNHGAAIINLLMASPFSMARDVQKFHRAILLGGSALSQWAVSRTPNQYFYLFAQHLGCETIEPHAKYKEHKVVKTGKEVYECIRGQSTENITLAGRKMPHPQFMSTWGPVVDGITVNEEMAAHLKKHPQYFQKYDLMVGMTESEAYNHLSQSFVEHGMSMNERENVLRTLVRNQYTYHRSEILNAVKNHYTDWTNPNMHALTIRKKALEALSDALYVAPAAKTAQLHAERGRRGGRKGNQEGKSTYMYVFKGNENDGRPTISGEDLPYILGYPLLTPGALNVPYEFKYNGTDRALSEVMMRFISNFAHSGDPNSPKPIRRNNMLYPEGGVPERYDQRNMKWPSYSSNNAKEQYLNIGLKPRPDGFYRAEHVAFWNELLPQLNTPGIGGGVEDDDTARHHFLPNHLNRASYYGEVYPFGGYFTTPPPPPMLPPPPAKTAEIEAKMKAHREKMLKDASSTSGDGSDGSGENPKKVAVAKADSDRVNSSILAITVAVGCAFLILNILVLAGIYHQRDKQRKERAKFVSSGGGGMTGPVGSTYTSYGMDLAGTGTMMSHHSRGGMTPGGGGGGGSGAPYINLNSPVTGPSAHMPPPPPPPGAASSGGGVMTNNSADADLHPQLMPGTGGAAGTLRTFGSTPTSTLQHPHHQQSGGTRGTPGEQGIGSASPYSTTGGAAGNHHHYPEAEPLLRGGGGNPNYCPRHGPKPIPPARSTEPGGSTLQPRGSGGLEEIQV